MEKVKWGTSIPSTFAGIKWEISENRGSGESSHTLNKKAITQRGIQVPGPLQRT